MLSKLVYYLLVLGIIVIFLQGCVIAEKTLTTSQIKLVKNQTGLKPVNMTAYLSPQETTGNASETKKTGVISLEKNSGVDGNTDTIVPVSEVASASMIDTRELTESEMEDGPYNHSEWITIGGSAGHIWEYGYNNLASGTDYHNDWGLCGTIKPGKSASFILPLAVKQEANIRYLKIVDYLPLYTPNPKIKIESVNVYNGYENVASYDPRLWISRDETIHYVDLGNYYNFDKGLQIKVNVRNNEENMMNEFIITGYGAKLEW